MNELKGVNEMAKQAKRQLAGSGDVMPAGSIGERLRATGSNAIASGNSIRGVGTLSIPSAGVWLISSYCYAAWSGATAGASHPLSSANATSNTFPEIGGAAGGLNDNSAALNSSGNSTVHTFPSMVAAFSGPGTIYLNVFTSNTVSASSTAWSITAVRIA